MEVTQKIALDSNATYLKDVGNGYFSAYLENGTLVVFNYHEAIKPVKKVKLGNENKKESQGQSIDVMQGVKGFVLCDDINKNAKVYDLKEGKVRFEVDWHKGSVESVLFSHSNEVVATGGQDGKTCLWTTDKGKLVMSLPPHNDFVTALSFSTNEKYIATGSFDKRIRVKNMHYNKTPKVLTGSHEGYIKYIRFLGPDKLLSVDNKGLINLWDLVESKLIAQLKRLPSEPVGIEFMMEEKFLIVAAKDKNLYLYDLEEKRMLNNKLMRVEEGISGFLYLEQRDLFLVGTETNELFIYDLNNELSTLETFMLERNYQSAYAMVEKNPLLKNSSVYEQMQLRWQKICDATYRLLEENEKAKVEQILAPYMEIAQMKSYITQVYHDFKNYAQFKEMAAQRKFSMVYNLANQCETFKETSLYKKVESTWKAKLERAKEGLLSHHMDGADVNKVLFDYKGVSHKAFVISSLIKESKVIELFRKRMEIQDFRMCYELVKQHPFLEELDDFLKLDQLSDALYKKALTLFETEKFIEAKETAEKLRVIPKYAFEANEMINNTDTLIAFYQSYRAKDYNKMLETVDDEPFLEDTKEYKSFNAEFQKKMYSAHEVASKGDVEEIKRVLKEYLDIYYVKEKIGLAFSVCYIYQLKQAAPRFKEDRTLLIACLNRYIAIFGYDENLTLYLDNIEEEFGITIDDNILTLKEPSYATWELDALPPSLV